jgi:tetratricopeptide (TPR) repeat protein
VFYTMSQYKLVAVFRTNIHRLAAHTVTTSRFFHSSLHTLNTKPIVQNAPNTNAHQIVKEAYQCYESNNLSKSQSLFEQGIPLLEGSSDPKDRLVLAITCNNMAELLRYMSKSGVSPAKSSKYSLKDIQKLYKKADSLLEQDRKTNDPVRKDEIAWWLGTLYNNFGLYFMENIHNYVEALSRFEKSLEIRQELFMKIVNEPNEKSEVDPLQLQCHIAITYNNIAQCHSNRKNYDLALHQFNEALNVFERVRNSGTVDVQYHRLYIITMNNIGLIHFNAGRYEEAVNQYTQALDVISGQNNNPASPGLVEQPDLITGAAEEMGVTLTNLATAFFKLGRLTDAEQFYRQALQVFEKVLVPTHKYIASTCTQLAMTLRQKHQTNNIENDLTENTLKEASSKLTEYRNKIYGNILNRFKKQVETTKDTQEKEKDLKESEELLARAKSILPAHAGQQSLKNRMFK